MPKSPRKSSPKRGRKTRSAKKRVTAPPIISGQDVEPVNTSASPSGILPISLGSYILELLGIRSNTDTTDQYTGRLVTRALILEDIATRQSDSEFSQVSDILGSYDKDDILIVEDLSYEFGERFFLCINEETVEKYQCFIVEEEVDPFTLPNIPYQPPTMTPWVDLGSGAEVESEKVVRSRQNIVISAFKHKSELLKPYNFTFINSEDNKELAADYMPVHDRKPLVERRELNVGIQATNPTNERCVGTEYKKPVNKSTQYYPRQMEEEEAKALMESSAMAEFVQNAAILVEECIMENSLIDPFKNIWTNLSSKSLITTNVQEVHLDEYQSFQDLKYSKDKQIICDQWHPIFPGVVAMSCAERISLDTRIRSLSKYNKSPSLILIWNSTNFVHPKLILESPSDCLVFRFNPTNPALIVGGCLNGRIVLWDINKYESRISSKDEDEEKRKPSFIEYFIDGSKAEDREIPRVRPVAFSALDTNSISSVSDIHWLKPPLAIDAMGKLTSDEESDCEYRCHQFISCSGENCFLVWDIIKTGQRVQTKLSDFYGLDGKWDHLFRNWHPLTRIFLPHRPDNDIISLVKFCLDCVKLEDCEPVQSHDGDKIKSNDSKDVHSKFRMTIYAGTSFGAVLSLSFKVRKDADSSLLTFAEVVHVHKHTDTVRILEFSPVDSTLLLTVGGYECSVLRVDKISESTPLLIHRTESTTRCKSATWSLTRAAIFFVGHEDGTIETRDILDATQEPVQSQTMSAVRVSELHCVEIGDKQALSVSDFNGTQHLLLIPGILTVQQANEAQLIDELADREKHYQTEVAAHIKMINPKIDNKEQETEDHSTNNCSEESHEIDLYDLYLKQEAEILQTISNVEI